MRLFIAAIIILALEWTWIIAMQWEIKRNVGETRKMTQEMVRDAR